MRNQQIKGNGGALSLTGGNVTIIGGSILGNTASSNGGAISSTGRNLTIID